MKINKHLLFGNDFFSLTYAMTSIYKILGMSLLLSLITLTSCSKSPERVEIEADTLIAMSFSQKSNLPNDAIYQWFFVNKPNESKSHLEVDFTQAQFLPDMAGEYDVHVTVLDSSGEVLAEQDFQFNAAGIISEPESTPEVAEEIKIQDDIDIETADLNSEPVAPEKNPEIEENIPEPVAITSQVEEDKSSAIEVDDPITDPIPEPISTQPEENQDISKKQFHIQIAALETDTRALKEKDYIESLGYLVDIEKVYRQDLDKVYYRIRLNGIYDYKNAKQIQSELIESTRYKDIWLAPAE